jgi:hypothetical protein
MDNLYLNNDDWEPGRKGISLDLKYWRPLEQFQSHINEAIAERGE